MKQLEMKCMTSNIFFFDFHLTASILAPAFLLYSVFICRVIILPFTPYFATFHSFLRLYTQ